MIVNLPIRDRLKIILANQDRLKQPPTNVDYVFVEPDWESVAELDGSIKNAWYVDITRGHQLYDSVTTKHRSPTFEKLGICMPPHTEMWFESTEFPLFDRQRSILRWAGSISRVPQDQVEVVKKYGAQADNLLDTRASERHETYLKAHELWICRYLCVYKQSNDTVTLNPLVYIAALSKSGHMMSGLSCDSLDLGLDQKTVIEVPWYYTNVVFYSLALLNEQRAVLRDLEHNESYKKRYKARYHVEPTHFYKLELD